MSEEHSQNQFPFNWPWVQGLEQNEIQGLFMIKLKNNECRKHYFNESSP